MSEHDNQTPDITAEREAPVESLGGRVAKFFFGSIVRAVGTVLLLFCGGLVIYAFNAPPPTQAPVKISKGSSVEDITEINKSLTAESQKLKQENAELRAKAEAASQGGAPKPDDAQALMGKMPPVSPGAAIAAAAQPQMPTGPVGPVVTPPSPLQRISVTPDGKQVAGAYVNVAQAGSIGQPGAMLGSQEQQAKLPKKNMMAGSRARAALPHGIIAVKGLPYPVVLDLRTFSQGPNRTMQPVKDCAVMAIATADLSSERVHLQPKTLNCYIHGEYVEQKVDGYVVDLLDNNFGIKGEREDRAGSYIALMLGAAFASGLSKGAAQMETTTIVTDSGASISSPTGNAMRAALYSGGGSAGDALSRTLQQRADAIQPFVKVPATDQAMVVFSDSVALPDGKSSKTGRANKEVSWTR